MQTFKELESLWNGHRRIHKLLKLWTPESLKCPKECDNLWIAHSRIQESLNCRFKNILESLNCRLKNAREPLNCRLKNSKEKNGHSKNLRISKKIADSLKNMQRISELWDSRILFRGSPNFRLKEFERIYALADSRI